MESLLIPFIHAPKIDPQVKNESAPKQSQDSYRHYITTTLFHVVQNINYTSDMQTSFTCFS